MPLLFIMYSVIQNGLTNQDPRAMLSVFDFKVVDLQCSNLVNGVVDAARPCIDTVIPALGNLDVSKPSTFLSITLGGFGLGLSILAILGRGTQFIQSRMMLPLTKPADDDQNTKIQRQTMMFLPLISIAYGGFLPAGLFIYWITANDLLRSPSST